MATSDLSFGQPILTSGNNSRIKNIIKLRKAAYRRQARTFIIEGRRELSRAIAAGIGIKEIYFCPAMFSGGDEQKLIGKALRAQAAVFEISEKVYEKIAFGNRKEGLIALADEPGSSLDDITPGANPLFVVMERVEKPGNVGAIVRTAYAAGADAVIAADTAADLYNPAAVRASIGTLFGMRVAACGSLRLIQWLKARNIQIVCASAQAKSAYTAVDFKKPTAIVLGSEEKGLSEIWKRSADFEAAIPMQAGADSLNVSAAAGILLFEAVRQRKT